MQSQQDTLATFSFISASPEGSFFPKPSLKGLLAERLPTLLSRCTKGSDACDEQRSRNAPLEPPGARVAPWYQMRLGMEGINDQAHPGRHTLVMPTHQKPDSQKD